MSCRPLDVESFRNRARLPKGITRRKRAGYDESKKVSRTLLFFLPHARPVPVKVGLERNRSAVGKTANSLVYPRRQQLTPSGPGSTPHLNQGDPPCQSPAWPRMTAGSVKTPTAATAGHSAVIADSHIRGSTRALA